MKQSAPPVPRVPRMGPCLVPFFEDYRPDAHGTPDPRLVVRPARAGDAPAMAAVARTRGPQPAELDGRIAAWVSDEVRRVVVAGRDDEGRRAVVAGQDDEVRRAVVAAGPGPDEVVGWGMAARWTGHEDAPDGWYVGWLVVDPRWRRRGVADRIVADLLTWTAGRSDRLYSVVNARNLASIDLHARHGFREVARAGAFAGIAFTGGVGVLLESRTAGR